MAEADRGPGLSRHRTAVVADPFPVSRQAVASLIRHSDAVDVAEQAGDQRAALELLRRLRADVVISDVDLERRGAGLALCRQAKRLPDPPTVLIFTGADDPAVVAAALASGADGFVHRTASPERLLQAVDTLAAGRPVWYLREHGPGAARDNTTSRIPGLTAREQQVLGLLLGRYSNDEIAGELHLARQTVKNHVSSVLQKIGVASRKDLLISRAPLARVG
ncbi:response regulator [Streptomyces alanosinicus]|uniref:DNA-binding response regulator n=1 Tax=Streptomyces alanosinicus TaxID=68171 RepID=A0A918YRQ3_9ACTN|nr:response regulator transcription factor [Streptomyces alanosinicus]GHE12661.1 DNA-binding response regulator [Streptomyces alanosinicus]